MKSHYFWYGVCHDSLQKCQFSEVKPSQTHFWEPPSFSRQLLVRVVNHTLLLIRSVSRFSTWYWPHSGARLSLKRVPSLANCADMTWRLQGPEKEAFAFLWMGSLPRKLKTTRTSRRCILQTCKSKSRARWNKISFVSKLLVSEVRRHFWKVKTQFVFWNSTIGTVNRWPVI